MCYVRDNAAICCARGLDVVHMSECGEIVGLDGIIYLPNRSIRACSVSLLSPYETHF